MSDSPEKLSHATLALHWLVAIGIIGMIAFGLYLEELPREAEGKRELIQLHKAFGVCMLVLVLARIFYRIKSGFLPQVADGNYHPYDEKASKMVVHTLLLASLVLPLSGMLGSIFAGYDIHVFGLFTIPAVEEKMELATKIAFTCHAVTAWLVIVVLFFHIAGAMKHHFLDEDGTLKRMLGKTIKGP